MFTAHYIYKINDNKLASLIYRRKNDILLKAAFEEWFASLLRFFFVDADSIFDMERGFGFMDKELLEIIPEVNRKGGSRFVDMLVKVYLRSGTEEWILVHIEIEGSNDKSFARRMFTYYYRALDRFEVGITALAVFTGEKKQLQPSSFCTSLLGTELTYKYSTHHILNYSESELLAMDNPFALVVLAAQKALLSGKIPEEELAEHRWTIAKALIESRQYTGEQITRFLAFLREFLFIESSSVNSIFEKRVDTLTGKIQSMGIIETIMEFRREEGFEEGAKQTSERVVINLLEKLGLSDEQAADIADVSVEFVKEIRASLENKG